MNGKRRSQVWAWGSFPPPKKNIAPPTKMKTISPFRLGLMFFSFSILYSDQWKIPQQAEFCFSLRKKLAQISAEISPPPKTKNPGYVTVNG